MSSSGRHKRKPFGSNAANSLPTGGFQKNAIHKARRSIEPSSTRKLAHPQTQVLLEENHRDTLGENPLRMIKPELRGGKENDPTVVVVGHDSKTPKTANLASAVALDNRKIYPSERNRSYTYRNNPLKKPDPRQSPRRDPSPLKRPDPLANFDGDPPRQKRKKFSNDNLRSTHNICYYSRKSIEISKSNLHERSISNKSTGRDPEGKNTKKFPSTCRRSRSPQTALSETSDMDITCSSPNKIASVTKTSTSNSDNDRERNFGISSNVKNLKGEHNASKCTLLMRENFSTQ